MNRIISCGSAVETALLLRRKFSAEERAKTPFEGESRWASSLKRKCRLAPTTVADFRCSKASQDVFDFLRQRSDAEKFQIIFADPPYKKARGKSHTEKLLNNQSLSQSLEPNGIFVLEKRPTDTLPQTTFWRVIRQKTYGATDVLFLEPIRN